MFYKILGIVALVSVAFCPAAMASQLEKNVAACTQAIQEEMGDLEQPANVRFQSAQGAGWNRLVYKVYQQGESYKVRCKTWRGKVSEIQYPNDLEVVAKAISG